MRYIDNNEGVALVTSLLMTMISLTIIMSVLYMITQNITRTGAMRRYNTAIEASYGGTDLIMKEIVPFVVKNSGSGTFLTQFQAAFPTSLVSLSATQASCLQSKVTLNTDAWVAACGTAAQRQSLDAKTVPDMTMQLQASGGQPFTVYTKIVDTVNGNSDMSGLQLEGAGVAESQNVISPQHLPFVYRLEIQAERSTNATEQANMSVLYAY